MISLDSKQQSDSLPIFDTCVEFLKQFDHQSKYNLPFGFLT